MLEASTGKVLFEKNSTETISTSFNDEKHEYVINHGSGWLRKIILRRWYYHIKNSCGLGGSQIFLQEGETYKLKDLLKGVAVASGNDITVTEWQ